MKTLAEEYETKSIARIQDELKARRIDARKTIKAVQQLLERAQRDWEAARRSHHQEKEMIGRHAIWCEPATVVCIDTFRRPPMMKSGRKAA